MHMDFSRIHNVLSVSYTHLKERELAEEEALLKAMQRGELPQGDE